MDDFKDNGKVINSKLFKDSMRLNVNHQTTGYTAGAHVAQSAANSIYINISLYVGSNSGLICSMYGYYGIRSTN